jgi:glutamate-1-semialdehyde 2,1-aminomutase
MKNKIVFNERYQQTKFYVEKAENDIIIINKKSFYDLSFCSGVLILGHNSKIQKQTLKDFNKKKVSIFAHPNIYAEKLAKIIKVFFPRFSKIVFCNSGTESVIKTLRICRSINKKKFIVSVSGSWHGSVDQTLYSPGKNLKPHPISAGLDPDQQKNLKFIPYNDIKKSKLILDKIKKNINCLIVEPIMGSLPSDKSRDYLKFLETYCKKNKIIIIFDEIITGFRSKKGSVQSKFNLKPDITLIGKVLGGGFPIGAIGMSKDIINQINKNKNKIVFGGTFSANSFSVYAGLKVLNFIKKYNNFYEKLENKSLKFQSGINNFVLKNNIDAWVYRFDTMSRLVFSKKKIQNRMQRDFLEKNKNKKIENFKRYLFNNNIYYPPSGIIFFSLASSQKNIDKITKIFRIGLLKYFSRN